MAGRILISNLHKQTSGSLLETSKTLRSNVNPDTRELSPLISDDYFALVEKYANQLESMIDYERDYLYGFIGFSTLQRQSYLIKMGNRTVERPQHFCMRVALNMHADDLTSVKTTYDSLSKLEFIHATPTGLNSGTPNPQLSSCFLLPMCDDSIEGIYKTLYNCAVISKSAGGFAFVCIFYIYKNFRIGFPISSIRSEHSYIAGSNGMSPGIVPMLRVFNETAKYVDQGGGLLTSYFTF